MKKAINQEVRELAEKRGPSLLRALIDISEDRTVPTTLRIAAAKEALPFLLPKLEQIAVTGPDGERLQDRPVEMIELMKNPEARRLVENLFSEQSQRARMRMLESAPPAAQPVDL